MDKDNQDIPIKFDSKILHMLENFDNTTFAQWNAKAGYVEFTNVPSNCPYAIPEERQINVADAISSGFIYSQDIKPFDTFIHALCNGSQDSDPVHGEIDVRLSSADKKDYIWSKLRMLIFPKNGSPWSIFGLIRNIDEEKRSQLKLLHEAEHDPLTDFLNKQSLRHHAEQFFNDSSKSSDMTQSALFIIDADGFKTINDTLGHLFGDSVLTEMSREIRKYFRHTDILGRIGGDEFVVISKGIGSGDILRTRCENLISDTHRTYHSNGKDLPFSISIGVALYPVHGSTFPELFKHADMALYEAKRRGKNTYCFYKPSILNDGNGTTVPERIYNNEAEYQQKMFRDNMLEFIFKLLYELKSPDAVINVTLRMLSQRFGLDRVGIVAFNLMDNSHSTVYEFTSPLGTAHQPLEASTDEATMSILERSIKCVASGYHASQWGTISTCSDVDTLETDDAAAFHKLGTSAYLYMRASRNGVDVGFVSFELEKPHEFSTEELRALNVFTGLLVTVLMPQETDPMLLRQNRRLIDIIDRMQEMVYVIDKDTFEPLFLNQTIRQALQSSMVKQACYFRFHRFDKPCPNCPVLPLSENGREYIVRIVSSWGTPAKARAFNIDWEKGRHAALVIMDPM